MRLISQSKLLSVNFDLVRLALTDTKIFACINDEKIPMASYKNFKYSTLVFDRLHRKYKDGEKVYEFPSQEQLEKEGIITEVSLDKK